MHRFAVAARWQLGTTAASQASVHLGLRVTRRLPRKADHYPRTRGRLLTHRPTSCVGSHELQQSTPFRSAFQAAAAEHTSQASRSHERRQHKVPDGLPGCKQGCADDTPCPPMAPGITERTVTQVSAPARPAAVGSDLSTTSSSAGAEMVSAAAALSNAPRTGSSACVQQPNSHAYLVTVAVAGKQPGPCVCQSHISPAFLKCPKKKHYTWHITSLC